MMVNCKKYAIKCFNDEAQAILDLIPLLTDDFDKAIVSGSAFIPL